MRFYFYAYPRKWVKQIHYSLLWTPITRIIIYFHFLFIKFSYNIRIVVYNICENNWIMHIYRTTDVLSMKAASSCINFVLQSAARHGAVDSALSSELQQLGLPREHSAAICKVYNEQCAAITNKLREQSLRGRV